MAGRKYEIDLEIRLVSMIQDDNDKDGHDIRTQYLY